MTQILLLHHIQGLTPGVTAFADTLRNAGHTVWVPDVFDGRTFDTLAAGYTHLREVGFAAVTEKMVRAADDLPDELVYVGMSLGVVAAQQLAQTRAGARGALLLYSFVPPSEFGAWPAGLPAQIHAMDHDPSFVDEGDIDAARPFVKATDNVEMFLYPGNGHLFLDATTADYDAEAAELATSRMLEFLGALT